MKENIKKIIEISQYSKDRIGETEESVKINFIVPLLESLGHNRLDFEYKFKDILLKKELPQNSHIIIETKNYEKHLGNELIQLEKYCHEERPLLGILANGTEIRIYSYFWKYRKPFEKLLIYQIKRSELNDKSIIQKIINILSKDNLISGDAHKYIDEREKEIEEAEQKIRKIVQDNRTSEITLKQKISELQNSLIQINEEIKLLENQILTNKKLEEKEISSIFLVGDINQKKVTEKNLSIEVKNLIFQKSEIKLEKKDYKDDFIKEFNNPNTLISRIYKLISESDGIEYGKIKDICLQKGWSKSRDSGSFGASRKTLKVNGKIEGIGRGDSEILRLKK